MKGKEQRIMKKFEIGKRYSMTSICDQNCVWSYTIVKRTNATVTLFDGESEKVCRIVKKLSEYRNAESVRPLGNYSMCPILSADSIEQ